jgi:dynein heavy chain
MFTSVSRALFEAHKKLFSFLICSTINKKSGVISLREWNLFSKGPGLKPKNFKETVPNPDPKYFSDNCWFYLHRLAEIPDFATLLTEIKNNTN